MDLHPLAMVAAAGAGLYLLERLRKRLSLSLAKHPSLRGHSKWSRRLARLVPYYSFDTDQAFVCDGAPPAIGEQRKSALLALAARLEREAPLSLEQARPLGRLISDVAFTSAYRVPFPFREHLPEALRQPSVLTASQGTRVADADGTWRQDVSGSYGVNVFGYDFYKECIDQAVDLARPLGPVLGPYHPVIAGNAERLARIAGLDEVSFHMSGTEAVMQAVRLARYSTGRSHLVRFCGAYHGWWDGVQPGVGNQRPVNDVYTLADMSERSLRVIASRKDIACVLVNPLQALSPNSDAATDGGLLGSGRSACFDRDAYTQWLHRLRDVCTRAKVPLIFDEVLTGFRLDKRGAQGYFGVQADLVTYGKTLGGGLPIGALAGRADLMRRFDPDRPARVSLARGTFNCHPYVMAAMSVFLDRLESEAVQASYAAADALWTQRRLEVNEALKEATLPLRLEGMHSIWTVIYTQPSRFNWVYQFYLRAHGLELPWTGTGRLIFSLNYSDEDFAVVRRVLVDAAAEMRHDGWWWGEGELTRASIRKQLIREMAGALVPALARGVSRASRGTATPPRLEEAV
ncbi:MAG: aminotransferase class III-fold pyridoxal phosphate-dependent enzyme [Halieaceae bacterium]|jgi:glutamate-1-semialdehyde 2,1-aminomutase|nr:aminotransferase class III-fold pyridoxal phosphate-dependent enzyme [Halieaceae bacterium]